MKKEGEYDLQDRQIDELIAILFTSIETTKMDKAR